MIIFQPPELPFHLLADVLTYNLTTNLLYKPPNLPYNLL